MDECLFLSRLPVELRLKIYEYVLAFGKPLKLRQVVAGSKNTSILRANRTIYNEALSVFYDTNTITVARNDFCLDTDSELQTPLRRDQVRHLLVKNFSQSIRCSSFSGGNNMYLDGCCDVCKPDATSFILTLAPLPRIVSVTIDYHNHQREFRFIRDTIRGVGSTSLTAEHGFTIRCVGMAKYKLSSAAIPSSLSVLFADVAFNTIWSQLSGLQRESSHLDTGIPAEEQSLLERLRDEVDRDLPDQINLFYWTWKSLFPGRTAGLTDFKLQDAVDTGEVSEKNIESRVDQIVQCCRLQSAEDARRYLAAFRNNAPGGFSLQMIA